jgi:hypothetical protein
MRLITSVAFGTVWLTSEMLVSASTLAGLDRDVATLSEPLRLAREAFLASCNSAASAAGVGSYARYVTALNRDKALVEKGRLETFTREGKYYIKLDLEVSGDSGARHKVIIADGSGVFSSSSWQDPKKVPQGYVYHPKSSSPMVAGFPWDVSRLVFVDVDAIVKRSVNAIEVTELPGHGYRAKCRTDSSDSFMTFDFYEKDGFNVSRRVVYRDKDAPPVQTTTATWKKQNGTWYVEALAMTKDTRYRQGSVDEWELKYDSFDLNCSVPESKFTLEALNLKDKSRIIDFRPNEESRVLVYSNHNQTPQNRLDEMLAQVDQLPLRSDLATSRTQPIMERTWIRFVFAALLFLVGALMIWRRRSKPATN